MLSCLIIAVQVERRTSMMSEGRRLSVTLNGTGGALVPVQLRFIPGDVFGEERAFHNASLTADASSGGYLHAPHTVLTTEANNIIIEWSEMKHLEILMKAYKVNLRNKMEVLRSVSSFGKCTVSSMQAMAARCVRRYIPKDTTMCNEGDMSDNVYFCVRGQMEILLNVGKPDEKLLNILGAGSCFGEWGVVNNERRTAALVTATNCEVLVIAGYHFKATCDIDMLESLASQGASMKVAQAKADADGKDLAIGLAASLSLEEDHRSRGALGKVKRQPPRSKTLSELAREDTNERMTQSEDNVLVPQPPSKQQRRRLARQTSLTVVNENDEVG